MCLQTFEGKKVIDMYIFFVKKQQQQNGQFPATTPSCVVMQTNLGQFLDFQTACEIPELNMDLA